jgi:protein-L-isoaspartate(D-aspartate) O-methyltransferase
MWWVWLLIVWLIPVIYSFCHAQELADETSLAKHRANLVKYLSYEISDKLVLDAMAYVPRHQFVPKYLRQHAYKNHPLPIGERQTISQPFIVAYMTQSLKLSGSEKVLEIGTGSGYQAAILSRCAAQVYSIEILPKLSKRAKKVLAQLKFNNVFLKVGDGYDGWSEHAPYDAIIVTAAADQVPPPLIRQLKEGGRMSIPLGGGLNQWLITYIKREGVLLEVDRLAVRFVPMTGKSQE